MRRSCALLVTPTSHNYPSYFSAKSDRRGRYSCDAVAEEMGEDPEYILALSQPLKYSMRVPNFGGIYPAEEGRSSRPGGDNSQRKTMFPLYQRKPALFAKKKLDVRYKFGSY
jgi:hypothetical protein